MVPQNAEEIWPHRQKELIREVNKHLGPRDKINSHDIFCIKKKFDILNSHPEFAYKPHHLAGPQYSDAFVGWLVGEFKKDNTFFKQARQQHREKTE
jgi:hypothetical protein